MTDRGKLIELVGEIVVPYFSEQIADHLHANGVAFVTDTDVGSKWIPVTERLPEENRDGSVEAVLVTDGFLQHMAYFARGEWCFVESGEMKEPMWYSVTHWMPLPYPPETDGGAEND